MSTPVRIGVFVAGLAVLFGAAFGAGKLFEDEDRNDGAYSLRLGASSEREPAATRIGFTVLDDSDDVVTGFTVRHDKPLHLIAVRKDFGGYAHLHPTMDAKGVWSVVAGLRPGSWRLYADFQPTGGDLQVLTSDIEVAGAATTEEPTDRDGGRTWAAAGYSVQVEGDLLAGGASDLRFQVFRNGEPVTDLEPYLGAFGHLVVIRDSDLSYQHAHPEDGPAGPEIPFGVEVPTEGGYHLFVDFQHDAVVRTASFELDAVAGTDQPAEHGGDHGNH